MKIYWPILLPVLQICSMYDMLVQADCRKAIMLGDAGHAWLTLHNVCHSHLFLAADTLFNS